MQRRAVCARSTLFVSPSASTLPNLGPQRWPPASWPARARETPRRQLRLRLDVAQSKPVQLSLAPLVVFAARLAELSPAGFIAAAGLGLLALAYVTAITNMNIVI